MATLRIDKDTFTNERDVVKEERRMRVDNQPYGRLNEIIYDQAFTVAPVQAPDDRQHGRSRSRVASTTSATSTTRTTCRRTRR